MPRWQSILLAWGVVGLYGTPVYPGVAKIVGYISPLDGSVQEYGVYLPEAPAPSPAGYPAVIHMHGYGWAVSVSFSEFQRRWADTHGWILINLNARGPQFYEGVGDVETRQVVRDAHQRFGLDLSRLYLTGGSMGGTGAFRHGIRYPDLFAAAVGVDGWSDYREWHYHWYARADQRTEIEEFRRPLLEAASPYYWAGRARWNAIQAAVSGRDEVVLPENGINLYNALWAWAQELPGAYESRLFLDYEAGHGGATRLEEIYQYFLQRQAHADPPSFLCETPVLAHGQLYWASMLRQRIQGALSAVEGIVDPAPPGFGGANPEKKVAIATILTRNLSRLAVHLEASPASGADDVWLFIDGFLAYHGPPRTVVVCADFSPQGELWGWEEEAPEQALSGLHKSPELEGPIGEAFKRPFLVVYGTAGPQEAVARNRREAMDFARGWNAFMVHADAVRPLPEERVSEADLQTHSLILFGTEQTSRLLRAANAAYRLPVHVREAGVIVEDPEWGDRAYLGPQFGAFFCYPNPLADFRQYLVVCRGQWATKPDGTARQGLEYDLEKLPWAYPDYVVFNTDQRELPHVLNVNNKPPVTCYEAAYFVEAGYFDQEWRPCRSVTLDRVHALGLATRLIHVEQLEASSSGLRVLIADAAGTPVTKARVTVQAFAPEAFCVSSVTDESGWAIFPQIPAEMPAAIVNVMATGGEYDWQADRVRTTAAGGIACVVQPMPQVVEGGPVDVRVALQGQCAEPILARVVVPCGEIEAPQRETRLSPETKTILVFRWQLPDLPEGRYKGFVEIRSHERRAAFCRPFCVAVRRGREGPLFISELKADDIVYGSFWRVTARLTNLSAETVRAVVRLALPKDRLYPEPQRVAIEPQGEALVVFAQSAPEQMLEKGTHPVRIVIEGYRGATAYTEFTVR